MDTSHLLSDVTTTATVMMMSERSASSPSKPIPPASSYSSSAPSEKTVWYRKRAAARSKTRRWIIGVALVYLMLASTGVSLTKVWKAVGASSDELTKKSENVWNTESVGGFPELRLRREASSDSLQAAEDNETCRPRAIDNFPGNFFTLKDTQDGGVAIHILLSLYLFAALAIVCDEYFVPSLEHICEDLGLQEDVAGATFMAAGSSAPELCTSIVGVFIAKSDVGVGTIVGSAVFNILCIIGLCGLLAGMIVELTWYPLVRDTLFYLLSVLALVLVIMDSKVYWYEALVMLFLYALYIVLMYFNRRLEYRAIEKVDRLRARWCGTSYSPKDEEKQALLVKTDDRSSEENGAPRGGTGAGEAETNFGNSQTSEKEVPSDKRYESPWEIPDHFLARVYWVGMLPVKIFSWATIPDCRRGGKWRKFYPLTFLVSVIWIAIYTYVMVWMITIAGDALDIPDTVMGLTLLAAGTSLPDCLSSIIVARDGFGDMAVSNSIGSNVFDILICLGLPWIIETAIVNSGDSVAISSSGLLYSSLTLLATVIFLLVSIAVNKWRLTKGYGVLCLLFYVLVITLSSLYELNIFGDLNPPSCPR